MGSLVLAPLSAAAQTAPAPETLFTTYCAACHSKPENLLFMLPDPGGTDLERWLDNFLKRHHTPDATSRAAISEWLASLKAE